MAGAWFHRRGILFIPSHPLGWVILLCCMGMVVRSFITIDAHAHSASDTLMNVAFRGMLVAMVYTVSAFLINLLRARLR